MKSLRYLDDIEPPKLFVPWFPKEEHEPAGAMWHQFHALVRFVQRFGYALALYDEAERLIDEAGKGKDRDRSEGGSKTDTARAFMLATEHSQVWQDIAIRDAAMTIHDFHRTMINIQSLRQRCPEINALIDGAKITLCFQTFAKNFPEAKHVRHAASHPADLWGTPGKFKANAGEHGNLYHGVRIGERMVHYTINQKLLAYEISQQSLDKMKEITVQFFTAFEGVDKVGHQRMLEKPMHHGID